MKKWHPKLSCSSWVGGYKSLFSLQKWGCPLLSV